MYVIIVYDVEQKRVQKVCSYLRRYLHWVQNSVFEGNLTESQLEKVKRGLRKRIKEDRDSAYIYILPDEKWVEKEVLGQTKAPTEAVI